MNPKTIIKEVSPQFNNSIDLRILSTLFEVYLFHTLYSHISYCPREAFLKGQTQGGQGSSQFKSALVHQLQVLVQH